jgi:hypothetical protein
MKQCNAFEEGRPTEDKGRAASSSFSPKNAMLSVRYQRKPVRQFRQFQIERIKREIGCVMKESPVNSKRTFLRHSQIVHGIHRKGVERLGQVIQERLAACQRAFFSSFDVAIP